MHNYMIVGVQLIFSSIIFSCGHSSFCDVADKQLMNFDPNDTKFVLKSCFEKHERCSEQDLQEFMRHETSMASKNFSQITLSIQKRYIDGQGSHRRLFSSFMLNIHAESQLDPPAHSCEIIIIERLPLGVFADPFELEHLVRRRVFKNAAVFGDTNLELPTILSNQSLVEIHMDAGINDFTVWKRMEIHVMLPLHARYPPLRKSGHVRVKIGPPDTFLHCSLANQGCLVMVGSVDPGAGVWEVPAGVEAHARVVSFVTFGVALLSAAAIIVVSVCYSDAGVHANLKQL